MTISGLHPEPVEFVVEYLDMLKPLDPRVAGPAGNDHAHGKAVLGRQRLSIHFPRQEGILMKPLFHGQSPLKIRHSAERDIRAVHQ